MSGSAENPMTIAMFILASDGGKQSKDSSVVEPTVARKRKVIRLYRESTNNRERLTASETLQTLMDGNWVAKIALDFPSVSSKGGAFILTFGEGKATLVLFNGVAVPSGLQKIPRVGLHCTVAPVDSNAKTRAQEYGEIDGNESLYEHVMAIGTTQTSPCGVFVHLRYNEGLDEGSWQDSNKSVIRVDMNGKNATIQHCTALEENFRKGIFTESASGGPPARGGVIRTAKRSPAHRTALQHPIPSTPSKGGDKATASENRAAAPSLVEVNSSPPKERDSSETSKKSKVSTPANKQQESTPVTSTDGYRGEDFYIQSVKKFELNPAEVVILEKAWTSGSRMAQKWLQKDGKSYNQETIKLALEITKQMDEEIADFFVEDPDQPATEGGETPAKRRGRPKGSKNKPKAMETKDPDSKTPGKMDSSKEKKLSAGVGKPASTPQERRDGSDSSESGSEKKEDETRSSGDKGLVTPPKTGKPDKPTETKSPTTTTAPTAKNDGDETDENPKKRHRSKSAKKKKKRSRKSEEVNSQNS